MEHILPKLTDYSLGLLPADEVAQIESHVRVCDHCRQALGAERAVMTAVRHTLHTAGQLSPQRQQALMPALPAGRRPVRPTFHFLAAFVQPLAAVAVILVIAIGLFGLQPGRSTAVAATSTTTLTATATATATFQAKSPAIISTPPASPTPIAQLQRAPTPGD